MAKALNPPTIEYLQALRSEKESEYATVDADIEDFRKLRKQKKAVVLPEELRYADVEVRDSTVADETQRVVSTLTLNRPKLQLIPGGPGETRKRATEEREEWTEELLWNAGSYTTGQHTFVQAVDAVVEGGAWTKLVYKRDLWERRYALRRDQFQDDPGAATGDGRTRDAKFTEAVENAKRVAGPPLAWISVDVRTLYPVYAQGRLAEVLEVTQRPVHQALRQYRLGLDQQGRIVPEAVGVPMSQVSSAHVPSRVTFLEHWDETFVSYAIVGGHGDTQVISQHRHGYGRTPYAYAPGFLCNWEQSTKIGWGVAQTKRWLSEYLSFLLTIHAQQAGRDTFAPMYRTLDPSQPTLYGPTGEPLSPTEPYKLGMIHNGPPGSTLSAVPFPATSQALKEQIAMVKELIDSLLTPRVTGQIGSNLEGAGFAINQVLAEAKIYQDPLAKSIARLMWDQTQLAWEICQRKVRETVYVSRTVGKNGGFLGMAPEDLGDPVQGQWELDPERPSAKLIEERYWHERIQAGTASVEMAIEQMGDNPEQVRFQRDLEELRQEDWYKQERRKFLLQQVGRGDLLAKAAQLGAESGALPGLEGLMGAGGVPGGMGTPSVPDMGNLALAPGGGGLGPPPVAGAPGIPPEASAAPGAMPLAA